MEFRCWNSWRALRSCRESQYWVNWILVNRSLTILCSISCRHSVKQMSDRSRWTRAGNVDSSEQTALSAVWSSRSMKLLDRLSDVRCLSEDRRLHRVLSWQASRRIPVIDTALTYCKVTNNNNNLSNAKNPLHIFPRKGKKVKNVDLYSASSCTPQAGCQAGGPASGGQGTSNALSSLTRAAGHPGHRPQPAHTGSASQQ